VLALPRLLLLPGVPALLRRRAVAPMLAWLLAGARLALLARESTLLALWWPAELLPLLRGRSVGLLARGAARTRAALLAGSADGRVATLGRATWRRGRRSTAMAAAWRCTSASAARSHFACKTH
jgi:hypothetical protein